MLCIAQEKTDIQMQKGNNSTTFGILFSKSYSTHNSLSASWQTICTSPGICPSSVQTSHKDPE